MAKFTRNLIIWFMLSMSLLLISSTAAYQSIKELLSSAEQVTHTTQVIRNLEQVISILKDAETGQRGYLLTKNKVFLEPYNGAPEKALKILMLVREETRSNKLQQTRVSELKNLITTRLNLLQFLITKKKNGLTVTTDELLLGKGYMDTARKMIDIMEADEQNLLLERHASFNKFSDFTPVLLILTAVISLLITCLYFIMINQDFKKRVLLQNDLELREAEIRNRINFIEVVAARISDGDFSVDALNEAHHAGDNLDNIALHLHKMAMSLDHSFTLLHDNEWLQTGIADLNQEMIGEKNPENLCRDILKFLAFYTDSLIGSCYLMQKDGNLYLQSQLGTKPESMAQQFGPGEGFPGKAILSGKDLLVEYIDPRLLSVSFACGNVFAHSIIELPVFYEGQVIAVIELGSLKTYSERERSFLKKSTENIGIAIFSSLNRRLLQELVEETQSQSEELQVQHSELESMNTELESNAIRLQASEEELRVQQEELISINQDLEHRTVLLEEKNQEITETNLVILQNAEVLEKTTRYKSEFLANMSHELRTPLNSILLLSRLLAENHELNLNASQIESARVIQSSGNGLLTLIDEILDLSKIESGKMSLEYLDLSFTQLVMEIDDLFSAVAKQKQLEFSISLSDKLPLKFETDKLRLEQILRNLISNALKFTLEGSVNIQIYLSERPGFVNFKVSDTGIGIAADKQTLIFEAFQQADGSTSRKFGGTGLGLSISKELSHLLQGEINFTSQIGRGSEFILSLPLKNLSEEKMAVNKAVNSSHDINNSSTQVKKVETSVVKNKKIADPASINLPDNDDSFLQPNILKNKNVLIADDDARNIFSIGKILEINGMKVFSALDGNEAIQLLEKNQIIDIVLMDMMMPNKDGYTAMAEIRQNSKYRQLPILAITAKAMPEDREKCIVAGASDYISKPVDKDQLISLLRVWLFK